MKTVQWLSVFALVLVGCASASHRDQTTVGERSIAAEIVNIQCWKGFSSVEQNSNLALCQRQAETGQICETNPWKHGGAPFDVCLRGGKSGEPTRVVSCLKGFNQAEQNQNLRSCMQSISDGQVCETNPWKHGHAVYDVCIME